MLSYVVLEHVCCQMLEGVIDAGSSVMLLTCLRSNDAIIIHSGVLLLFPPLEQRLLYPSVYVEYSSLSVRFCVADVYIFCRVSFFVSWRDMRLGHSRATICPVL